MSFVPDLIARAKQTPMRIAFPEADDKTMLEVAAETAKRGFAHPVLVGKTDELKALCKELNYDEALFTFADVQDEGYRDQLIQRYQALPDPLLGPKGLLKRMSDPLKFALTMEAVGDADVTISGLNATTGAVLMSAMDIIGIQPGLETASSIGICEIPGWNGSEGNLIALADCSVRPDPTPAQLASIAITSCDTIRAVMGWTPRCAMLSFSTTGSASHATVQKVQEAVAIAHERRPDLLIDGEFQLDSAINPRVAAKKVKRPSEVAGKANILIFPELNAANIGVKLMQEFGGAKLYGVVLQGFNRICCDCSRGASVEELVGNMAFAVCAAANKIK